MPNKAFVEFLKIRLLQIYRLFLEIGIFRTVFLFLLAVHGIYVLYKVLSSAPWLCVALTFSLLLWLHHKRKDKSFLALLFGIQSRYIYLLEYTVLALPSLIFLLLHKDMTWLLILAIAVAALPHISIKPFFKRSTLNVDFFPRTAFEWKSGFRSSLFFTVILITCGTIWAERTFIPVTVIVLLTIIWSSYNLYSESRLMIEVFKWTPFRYLIHKISRQFAFSFCLLLPVNISFLYWNAHYWHILLFVNLVCHLVQSLSICFKYAMFVPNKNLQVNLILLCSAIGLFFFPWTAPVPVIILVIYFIRALNNLNKYLYVGS